jgi:hypothetical protein
MIYPIGCDHDKVQDAPAGVWGDGHKKLAESILKVIQSCNIVLIAEEDHPCYLKQKGMQSVALDVLTSLHQIGMATNVKHRFCDPCPNERRRRGIYEDLPRLSPGCFDAELLNLMPTATVAHQHDIGHRWPIREEFWIEQLGPDLHKEVLFVCGALHRITFRRRLEAKGAQVRIVEKRVGHENGVVGSELVSEEFSAYRFIRRSHVLSDAGCPCCRNRHNPQSDAPDNL